MTTLTKTEIEVWVQYFEGEDGSQSEPNLNQLFIQGKEVIPMQEVTEADVEEAGCPEGVWTDVRMRWDMEVEDETFDPAELLFDMDGNATYRGESILVVTGSSMSWGETYEVDADGNISEVE